MVGYKERLTLILASESGSLNFAYPFACQIGESAGIGGGATGLTTAQMGDQANSRATSANGNVNPGTPPHNWHATG